MGDVITIAANLSTKGFERGSKALRQAINSLSRSAAQFGRSTARTATSVIGNFKRMIPMILGVGSAFGVISKAVSSFMSQNEELASKMNSIWTALGNLIAPIMEKIINWVTTAVAYFLEFLRVLGVTGKTASQLSQKANKSTQELKKTLAGFDELNILQDNNNNNDNGNGNNVGLPDVKLPDWLKNFADLLKGLKWDEAADLLIGKINELIQKLKDKAYEAGYTVGEYLGKGLSAIAKIIEGVDWRGIGETLANFVNGIFNNPNMKGEDLGTILVAKFTIAFKILTAFLENFDGEAIGRYLSGVIKGAFDSMDRAIQQANPQKMGENIANFFNNIDWNGIALSVSNFLNDAVDWAFNALHSFLTTINAKDIGAAIRTFFENIDWNGIKEKLKQLLSDAWDVAIDFLWGIIAKDSKEEPPIIESLRKLKESVEKVFEKVEPLAQAVWDKLKPILEYVVTDGLPKFFEDLADTLEDLTKLLTGEMGFGEFIKNLNDLEVVIGLLIGLKAATFFGELAMNIGKFIQAVGGGAGGAATGGGGLSGAISGLVGGLKDLGAAAGLGVEALGEMTVSASGTTLAAGTLTAAGAGLLAAFGLIPAVMLDSKMSSDYFKAALEETGGSAEGMAQKMNELAETASHYEECLYDTTGATQELGYSAQESQHAMEAYQQFLPLLAEQLGITTDQLNAQIEAANGDVTQIDALRDSTSWLVESNNQTASSQQNLNNAMDETAMHIEGAATAANEAADNFTEANIKMQQSASETDVQADTSYSNVEANVSQKSENAANAVDTNSTSMETDTEQAFTNMETTVEQKMTTIENKMEQSWTKIVQTTTQKTTEMVSAVERKYQEMSNRVNTTVVSMADQVTSRFSQMSQNVIIIIDQMSSGVVMGVTNMMNSSYSTIDSIAGQIEARMAQMAQTAQQYATQAQEAAARAIEAANSARSAMSYSGGQWGADMTTSFYRSTVSGTSKIRRAVSGVASTISSFLHFSEPDEGPLSNFHTFAPDMMQLFREGILDGKAGVIDAAISVAEGVSEAFLTVNEELEKIGGNLHTLGNIQNRVQFRTPGVVGGGVVPYSVTDTFANSASTSSSYQSVMDQNDRIMEILGRILDVIMEGKVISVDKYKFGELLVKTLSNEARSRGRSLL